MEMVLSKIAFVNFQAAVALTLNYLCNFTSHSGLFFVIRQCRCTLVIRQYFFSINIISHQYEVHAVFIQPASRVEIGKIYDT